MNCNLEGKNVLITASSKGIGFAVADLFCKEGADVIISSSNQENLQNALKSLQTKYPNCNVSGRVCNLNKKEDIEELINYCNEQFGGVEILVNNCGGPTPGFFENLTEENWDYSYNQVLKSASLLIKLVLPYMKKNKWGRIINITSISVKQPVDNLLLSNTFRSALTAFSKTISNEVAPFNITINNVAPGYTLTDRFDQLIRHRAETAGVSYNEMVKTMSEAIPAKRFATPTEIASTVLFLGSELGSYITGTTIGVDGGLTKSTY